MEAGNSADLCVHLHCVVARFAFFPFGKVDGRIRPPVFDADRAFPPGVNLVPVVNLRDYPVKREALLNSVGFILGYDLLVKGIVKSFRRALKR